MRREAHGGFGERSGETDREQSRHRAPGLLSDEAGQGLKPPRGRTWGRRGVTPVVKVSNAGTKRVNLAGLIAFRPAQRPHVRLIHRSLVYHGWKNEKKGFDEHDYIRLLDGAHQQLRAPIVLVWDKCAVWRLAVSPTHSGGIWRIIPGSPDLPGGKSRRGPQHVREAVAVWRRPGRRAARPARYGQSWIA